MTFISAPTVVAPSGSSPATAVMAAFSISATIAGVAKTARSPEPIAAAVLPAATVAALRAESPFSSIIFAVRNSFIAVNRYLCRRHPGKPDAKTARVFIRTPPQRYKKFAAVEKVDTPHRPDRRRAFPSAGAGRPWLLASGVDGREGRFDPDGPVLPVYVFSRPVDLRRYRRWWTP